MNKIPWMEELIEDVLPDGTAVKANCRYWAKDVCVEMIAPYPGLRTSRHMMYMIPATFLQDDLWKRRSGDRNSQVLDAWREIARKDDSWCATMA